MHITLDSSLYAGDQAHLASTWVAGHIALGVRCRDHRLPVPIQIGKEWALACGSCGRVISVRDAIGLPYPITKRARQEIERARLFEEAAEEADRVAQRKAQLAAGKVYRLPSTPGRTRRRYRSTTGEPKFTRERIVEAMRIGKTRPRVAELLDCPPSDLPKILQRRGIPMPKSWLRLRGKARLKWEAEHKAKEAK